MLWRKICLVAKWVLVKGTVGSVSWSCVLWDAQPARDEKLDVQSNF